MATKYRAELNLPHDLVAFEGKLYPAIADAFLFALLRDCDAWTIRVLEPMDNGQVKIWNAIDDADKDEIVQRINEYYNAGTNEGEYKDLVCAIEEVITNRED